MMYNKVPSIRLAHKIKKATQENAYWYGIHTGIILSYTALLFDDPIY